MAVLSGRGSAEAATQSRGVFLKRASGILETRPKPHVGFP